MDFLALIPVLFFFLLVPLIVYFAIKHEKKIIAQVYEQYQLFAEKFKLESIPPSKGFLWSTNYPRVSGQLGNFNCSLYSYKTGGKNKVTYSLVELYLPDLSQHNFRIARKGFFSNIGIAMGMQDIPIGDATIDQNYVLKANNEAMLQQALSDSDTLVLLKELHHELKAAIYFSKGVLGYKEVGNINTEATRERFEKVSALLYKMATSLSQYDH